MEGALWKSPGHVTMSTMCYPYGSGITCVCDGGGNQSSVSHSRFILSRWLQHKLQAETYFGVFRTSVKRRKQPKGEEWLIGRQESIGGNGHPHIINYDEIGEIGYCIGSVEKYINVIFQGGLHSSGWGVRMVSVHLTNYLKMSFYQIEILLKYRQKKVWLYTGRKLRM